MGRKAGSLYINPKKFARVQKPCMQEMLSFLNCLSLNQNNDEKCVRQKEKLNACIDFLSRNKRQRRVASITTCRDLAGESRSYLLHNSSEQMKSEPREC